MYSATAFLLGTAAVCCTFSLVFRQNQSSAASLLTKLSSHVSPQQDPTAKQNGQIPVYPLLSLSGKINPPRVYEVHMYFDGNYSREAEVEVDRNGKISGLAKGFNFYGFHWYGIHVISPWGKERYFQVGKTADYRNGQAFLDIGIHDFNSTDETSSFQRR